MRVVVEKELQRAEDLVKEAQAALEKQDFKTANRLATEASVLDPSLAAATRIREEASGTAVKDNLDAAAKALEARQWDAALAAAAKVKEFEPGNTTAATIEKQVEGRSAATRMLEIRPRDTGEEGLPGRHQVVPNGRRIVAGECGAEW